MIGKIVKTISMSTTDYDIPDLQSILQTLKAFAPANNLLGSTSEPHAYNHRDLTAIPHKECNANDLKVENEEYEPEELQSIIRLADPSRLTRAAAVDPAAALPYGVVALTQDDKPRHDPTAIIDWLVGVRYTTKLLGNDEHVVSRIRKVVMSSLTPRATVDPYSDDRTPTRSRATVVSTIFGSSPGKYSSSSRWTGREALVEKQRGRVEGKLKLDAVL